MADDNAEWRVTMGNPTIRRIDGSVRKSADRARIVEQFAPIASGYPDIAGSDQEVDLLISTDVLSEGKTCRIAATLINYDLHWNPTRTRYGAPAGSIVSARPDLPDDLQYVSRARA